MWRRVLLAVAAAAEAGGTAQEAANGTASTWWWKEVLGAGPVVPDFGAISRHVCRMKEACVAPCVWRDESPPTFWHAKPIQPAFGTMLVEEWAYFPAECRRRGGAATALSVPWDGLGHVGYVVATSIAEKATAARGAVARRAGRPFFGEALRPSAG